MEILNGGNVGSSIHWRPELSGPGDPGIPLRNAVLVQPEGPSFGEALSSAVDAVSGALVKADALAAAVPEKNADIADAAIARARADVMLEIAAVTASRVSGAITQLMQTQL